jgi:uncharacterized protein YkwD
MPTITLRRTLLAAALATAVVAPTAPAVASAAHRCANADLVPANGNLGQVRRATMCLVNRQRSAHGLGRLHANRALGGVAQHYAVKMVAQTFFDHVSPGGSTFITRIQNTSYLHGARGWSIGENIAYGSGSLSTPRKIVRAWMNSAGHRANILNGTFHDMGMGIEPGTPVGGGGGGATYVNEFGTRTR